MLRIVLFYVRIMQEKETPVIREGKKNVSLQSSAGVQGDAVLLLGSGVPPASLSPRSPPQAACIGYLKSYKESRKYERSKKPTRKLLERKTNARAIQSLPPERNGAPFQWSALQQS